MIPYALRLVWNTRFKCDGPTWETRAWSSAITSCATNLNECVLVSIEDVVWCSLSNKFVIMSQLQPFYNGFITLQDYRHFLVAYIWSFFVEDFVFDQDIGISITTRLMWNIIAASLSPDYLISILVPGILSLFVNIILYLMTFVRLVGLQMHWKLSKKWFF